MESLTTLGDLSSSLIGSAGSERKESSWLQTSTERSELSNGVKHASGYATLKTIHEETSILLKELGLM